MVDSKAEVFPLALKFFYVCDIGVSCQRFSSITKEMLLKQLTCFKLTIGVCFEI